MSDLSLIHRINAAGVIIKATKDGNLELIGRAEAIRALADVVKVHKDELVAYLTHPRRRWMIHLGDGWRDSTFTPPASLAEVRSWYPEALAIDPEEDIPEEAHPV